MISTRNFSPITDKKILCTCGHEDCDQRSVSQDVLNMAQSARDALGFGLIVTSGGRCPKHPNEIHRSVPADHQKGQGIDISITGATRGNVVRAGLDAGFNAIGIAQTFVHWGYRHELPDDYTIMWVYK
tara:strand:- start:872 stop:1255 length:384 start_codon:yes stop_codon:yes gene_type:complete